MKIKKLCWYAVFVQFTRYIREGRIWLYLFYHLSSCLIPGLVVVLNFQQTLSCVQTLGFLFLCRIILTPFDHFINEGTAISELSLYPISLWEILCIRFFARLVQLSEWVYCGAVLLIYYSSGSALPVLYGLLAFLAGCLAEEFFSVLFYYLKKSRLALCGFYLLNALAVLLLLLERTSSLLTMPAATAGHFAALTFALVGLLFFACNWKHLTCFVPKRYLEGKHSLPLSSRLLSRNLSGNATLRFAVFEGIALLKWNFKKLIMPLGYAILFFLMHISDLEYTMLMPLFFIVEYSTEVGFNSFGLMKDEYGLFLFSDMDVKACIRGKNLALAAVLLFVSTLLTVVFGLLSGWSGKLYGYAMLINAYCTVFQVQVSVLLSILHFHLENSPKKHTVSHVCLMIALVIFTCILGSMLYQGGVLAAIVLIFILSTLPPMVFFCFIRVNLLAELFEKRRPAMKAVLHEAQLRN